MFVSVYLVLSFILTVLCFSSSLFVLKVRTSPLYVKGYLTWLDSQSINNQQTNRAKKPGDWLFQARQVEISPSLVRRVAPARRNLTIANNEVKYRRLRCAHNYCRYFFRTSIYFTFARYCFVFGYCTKMIYYKYSCLYCKFILYT